MITLTLWRSPMRTTLTLPMPDEKLQQELVDAFGDAPQRATVTDISPQALAMLDGKEVDLDELNFLAKSMKRFTQDEMSQFMAAVQVEQPTDLKALINLSFNLERYTLVQNTADLAAIGKRHLLNKQGGLSASEVESIDFEQIGRYLLSSGQGVPTANGLVFRNSEVPYHEVYNGTTFPYLTIAGTPLPWLSWSTAAKQSTVIGQFAGCFAGYFINKRWNREIPIHFTVKPEIGCMAAILKVGIPSTLVQVVTSLLAVYVNTVLITFSSTAVAVYGACAKIHNLVTVGVHGMDNGLIPIVAFNFGAKKPERIHQGIRWTMLFSYAFFIPFFLIMEIAPGWVLQLFNASGEMLSIDVTTLRILALGYLVSIVGLTISSAFQGLSMGVPSMILTMCRQVILPVVLVTVLAQFGNLSLLWVAFAAAEAIALPFALFFWQNRSRSVLQGQAEEKAAMDRKVTACVKSKI